MTKDGDITCVFGCVSLGASVDQQTGRLSVFDILEEVHSAQVPTQIPLLVISLLLERRNPEDSNLRFQLFHIPPSGGENLIGAGDLNFPARKSKMKAIFRFNHLPLADFGRHSIRVEWKNIDTQDESSWQGGFEVLAIRVQGGATTNSPGSSELN